jgi:uncharacterized protein YmfQ (DUF2313 family)
MNDSKVNLDCPHCGEKLKAVEMPVELAWGNQIQWACFNNDCSYYQDGWQWMWDEYNVKSSYRYRVTNSETGASAPLSVWSENAIVDCIINEED